MNYRNAPSLATAGKLRLIAPDAVILTPIVSFGQAVLSARRPACRKDNLLTSVVRLRRTRRPGWEARSWMARLPGKPSGHSVPRKRSGGHGPKRYGCASLSAPCAGRPFPMHRELRGGPQEPSRKTSCTFSGGTAIIDCVHCPERGIARHFPSLWQSTHETSYLPRYVRAWHWLS